MTKFCSKCEKTKPVDQFHVRRRSPDGLYVWCKVCSKEYQQNWYEKNRDKVKAQSDAWHRANPKAVAEYRRKARYGMPRGRYDDMMEEQGGKCGMAGCPNDIEVVDHNHETGKVRALLCHQCNKLIGFLENSHDLGQSAIEYVLRHRSQP